ncbi:efflux RND transporter periplasmic adaptor subunit [Mucilaginibacter sp. ZB1P21]|uniref:Efflux RND transporter periplasmic adaptor subunit n=2 Tax=Mucilaginibacter glaciei TaxID=2772109 RepID=A0A926NTB5_9SPHI|nr:efflux RND transporter periplasmic adaptor subunit [Mucilaginibacter glaciei]
MAAYPVVTGLTLLVLSSCGGGDKQAGAPGAGGPPQVQSYPVFSITPQNATLNTDYPASLQGEQNIEIRPKVDGFVDKIFIDEGSVVKIGQPLFSIKAPQYEQDVRNAAATISSAEADVSAAQLQVNKTKPLVDKDIISHFELESAQYTLQARKAALAQAKTTLAIARTNLGYTNIISPVNGVVGSIPYKIGSLVSSTNTQPLTTVSSIGQVYAYFSLNEKQLLDFSRNVKGKTLNQKLANTPAVTLILSDGSTYPEPGRIKTINGQINTETGAASFRATFPNPVGLLRSGSSASVRIPQQIKDGILVPQKSTYELQGKRFIYLVDQSGAVKSTEIEIMDKTAGQYFVVTKGLKAGDKVVYDGTSSLKDATKIKSEEMPADKVYQDLK